MKKIVVGFVLILFSIGLTIFNSTGITGAVIGTPLGNSISFLAAVCFILGLVLMTYELRRKNYAEEILKQGRYVDDTRELKSIARKCGYRLDEGHREGTRIIKDDGEVLTVIPNHRRIEGRGTVRGILKALATGESTFRQRTA